VHHDDDGGTKLMTVTPTSNPKSPRAQSENPNLRPFSHVSHRFFSMTTP
jgi:hypothetical protein